MILQEVDIEALGRVETIRWGYEVTLDYMTYQVMKLEWVYKPTLPDGVLTSDAGGHCFFWRVDHPIRAILKTQKYIEGAGWRNGKER